ncbi:MAG TPA: DEAD/DEAH box helicase [Candidatus Nanoarchaeia archaeon]|nr:DEAD/DEAH box helicase [Candidatus Nanoarchaeia archaeon]
MSITFETLNVKSEIIRALKEEGIINPTNIQEQAIPIIKQGKDLIGISRTGSGKTAAFGIPLLEKVSANKGVQALVLAPTRELANQISNELRKWSKYLGLKVAVVFGGVGFDQQVRDISRSEVVVGTPGRLLDHLGRSTLNLSKVNYLVLDEADKMVEMGFIEDIERIISTTPKHRQTMLFGATISNEIDYLKKKYMHNVEIAESELHVKKDLLEQYYYDVQTHEKFSLLVHLLKKEKTGRVIIFCSKRSTVELLNKNLRAQGIKSEMIHGKMSQNNRLNVIERFNKGKTDYLVASSVAARGLDIKDVTHVFNYDLSKDSQEYIHRIGRTARAGESGKAITLLSSQDHGTFSGILRQYDIEVNLLPAEEFPKLRFETRSPGGDGSRSEHNRFGRGFRGGAGGRSFGRNSYSGRDRRPQDNSSEGGPRRDDRGPSREHNHKRPPRGENQHGYHSKPSNSNWGRSRR